MNILSLINLRPKADTAEALRASLAGIEGEIAAARARIGALEARTGQILLDATPEEAAKHEASIEEQRQQLRRLDLIAAELPPRIKAADEREARAALEAERREAIGLSDHATALVAEIERAGIALLRLVAEHDGHVTRIRETNRRLAEAGVAERVPLPTARAWPNVNPEAPAGRMMLLGVRESASGPGEHVKVPGPQGYHRDAESLQQAIAKAKAPARGAA